MKLKDAFDVGPLRNQVIWCERILYILAGGAGLVLLAFYTLGFVPTSRRLEALKLQIESKQREVIDNQNRSSTLPNLAKEVQRLEESVRIYARQFPRDDELGNFIRDLTEISQRLSLGEWKLAPKTPKRGESYFALPIAMQFEGDFINAKTFLRSVENMQRLTRVQKLQIKAKDLKSGVVQVEVETNIYFSEG